MGSFYLFIGQVVTSSKNLQIGKFIFSAKCDAILSINYLDKNIKYQSISTDNKIKKSDFYKLLLRGKKHEII